MVMALLKRKWLYDSDNDTEIRDKNGDIMVSIMKGGRGIIKVLDEEF